MRINKYLAHKGHATRREADELIEKKKVFLNGKLAKLGDKVLESDLVEVRRSGKQPTYAYFAYNKAEGVNTHMEKEGKDILSTLSPELKTLKLFPLGRLDKTSEGLIILTNDGRVTDRLLNPKYSHAKIYEVKTQLPLRPSFKEKMENGVDIEGYVTKQTKLELIGDTRFRIELTEGKSHQIRRMCAALHNEVASLKRVRIMNITLGTLAKGSVRPIEGKELEEFLSALELV